MDTIPISQPEPPIDNVVTQAPVQQESKQNNKWLIIIPIFIFVLIFFSLVFLFVFKRQDGFLNSFLNSIGMGSTEVAPNVREDETPTATPDGENESGVDTEGKYNKEYFEKAERENRVLNDEEKIAYMKLNTKKDTVMGALLDNKEVICTSGGEGGEYAFVTNMYIKNGNIRIDNSSSAKEGISISSLVTMTDFWSWIVPSEPGSNFHQVLTSEREKFQMIEYLIVENGESEDYYKKSCKENSVEDSYFEKPAGINFNEVE